MGVDAPLDTVTVAPLAGVVPPGPVQVRLNVMVEVSGAVTCEPLAGSAPLQPPEAVQAAALVEDQVRVLVAPLVMRAGEAVSVTVGGAGGGTTVTVALAMGLVPPGPEQVR